VLARGYCDGADWWGVDRWPGLFPQPVRGEAVAGDDHSNLHPPSSVSKCSTSGDYGPETVSGDD